LLIEFGDGVGREYFFMSYMQECSVIHAPERMHRQSIFSGCEDEC
jgi:hypothetical protein